MEIMEFMDIDHDGVDKLFGIYVESCKAGTDASGAFMEFRRRIERHIAWEEEVLFGIVDDMAGKDNLITAELRAQHEQIKRLLDDIRQSLGRNEQTNALNDRISLLISAHEKMEDDSFYSWLDAELDEKAKDDALAAISEVSKRYNV